MSRSPEAKSLLRPDLLGAGGAGSAGGSARGTGRTDSIGTSSDWVPASGGESGAAVFRSADGAKYAKCVAAADAAVLADERDRTEWLGRQGVPASRVLDWHDGADGACLVTDAVRGVPADQVSAADLRDAWDRITDAVRTLHEVPVRQCPYRRDLDATVALAREVVGRGAVHPEFLPVEQQGVPADELLARLVPEFARRREQEAADTVVCHGDLCLPNIVLDPGTLEVAGFLDLGRLGLADRYADLALLLSNARETWPDEQRAQDADSAFAERYGIAIDHDRLRFYLHLDPLTWG